MFFIPGLKHCFQIPQLLPNGYLHINCCCTSNSSQRRLCPPVSERTGPVGNPNHNLLLSTSSANRRHGSAIMSEGWELPLDWTWPPHAEQQAAIAVWTRCYQLRVHPDIIQGLDRWFLAEVGKPITKIGKHLEGEGSHCPQGWDKRDWLTPLSHQRGTSMPNEKWRNGMTEGFEHCVKSQLSQIHWVLKMRASLNYPNYIDPFRIETTMVRGICHFKTYPHAWKSTWLINHHFL